MEGVFIRRLLMAKLLVAAKAIWKSSLTNHFSGSIWLFDIAYGFYTNGSKKQGWYNMPVLSTGKLVVCRKAAKTASIIGCILALLFLVACAPASQYDYCMDYCAKGQECIQSFATSECENGCLQLKKDNPFPDNMDRSDKVLNPQLRLCTQQQECEEFISCNKAYEKGESWPSSEDETGDSSKP